MVKPTVLIIFMKHSKNGGRNGCPRLQDINDFTNYVWGKTANMKDYQKTCQKNYYEKHKKQS